MLQPVVRAGHGGAFSNMGGWIRITSAIDFGLRNIGRRRCREPFLRVSPSCDLQCHSHTFDQRLKAWKATLPGLTAIHVEDELHCLRLGVLASFETAALRGSNARNVAGVINSLRIFSGADNNDMSNFRGTGLDQIVLDVQFGAENAAARKERFVIERKHIALRLLASSEDTIKEMVRSEIGDWPRATFDQIRHEAAALPDCNPTS